MGQRLGLRVPNLIALLCAVHERVSVLLFCLFLGVMVAHQRLLSVTVMESF